MIDGGVGMGVMARVRNDSRDAATGRLAPAFDKRPEGFEQTFLDLGRVGCEEHYGVGRLTVNRWLTECGKERLIEERHAVVARREAERLERQRLSRRDVGKLLQEAYRPQIRDRRKVSITLARHAAQHLRIVRNGGFIVSQAPNGDWRVGTKLVSPAQLLDLALARGFIPSLTGDE